MKSSTTAMTSSDELDEIFRRIEAGDHTSTDVKRLRQLLIEPDQGLISQLGRYNIELQEGKEIHIGDRIFNIDLTSSLEDLIQAIQSLRPSEQLQNPFILNAPFVKIEPDVESANQINSNLELAEQLYQDGQLSPPQEAEFDRLKQEAQSISNINREIKALAERSEQLLQSVLASLKQSLEELDDRSRDCLIDVSSEATAIESRISILEKFIQDLTAGRKLAKWIGDNSSRLAKRVGKLAINEFPDISTFSTEQELDDFYFSIVLLLGRLSHALQWGRPNILEFPKISQASVNIRLYEAAFHYLKLEVPARYESAKGSLEGFIEYLLRELRHLE